jgi:acylphosphatase
VGYRLFLIDMAESFEFENFYAVNAKKDKKQIVKIYLEHSERSVMDFFNEVKQNFPAAAQVDSVDMEEYEGQVKTLISFRSAFMTYQLSKIANTGVGIINVQGQTLTEPRAFRKESGEKQDKMLEKQDQTLNVLKDIKSDTSQIKSDTSQIKSDTSGIPGIDSNTSEMKETLAFGMSEIITIKREQSVIKKILHNENGQQNFNSQYSLYCDGKGYSENKESTSHGL